MSRMATQLGGIAPSFFTFLLITAFGPIFNFDDTVKNFSLSVHLSKNCKKVYYAWGVIF